MTIFTKISHGHRDKIDFQLTFDSSIFNFYAALSLPILRPEQHLNRLIINFDAKQRIDFIKAYCFSNFNYFILWQNCGNLSRTINACKNSFVYSQKHLYLVALICEAIHLVWPIFLGR